MNTEMEQAPDSSKVELDVAAGRAQSFLALSGLNLIAFSILTIVPQNSDFWILASLLGFCIGVLSLWVVPVAIRAFFVWCRLLRFDETRDARSSMAFENRPEGLAALMWIWSPLVRVRDALRGSVEDGAWKRLRIVVYLWWSVWIVAFSTFVVGSAVAVTGVALVPPLATAAHIGGILASALCCTVISIHGHHGPSALSAQRETA